MMRLILTQLVWRGAASGSRGVHRQRFLAPTLQRLLAKGSGSGRLKACSGQGASRERDCLILQFSGSAKTFQLCTVQNADRQRNLSLNINDVDAVELLMHMKKEMRAKTVKPPCKDQKTKNEQSGAAAAADGQASTAGVPAQSSDRCGLPEAIALSHVLGAPSWPGQPSPPAQPPAQPHARKRQRMEGGGYSVKKTFQCLMPRELARR